MGSVIAPFDRDTIVQFLNDACSVHVDGVTLDRGASGLALRFEYRDERGHRHSKTISSPQDGADTLTDLVVMASEWLCHGSTRTTDMMHGQA